MIDPPVSETELLEKANGIAGQTLQQIARLHNISVPENLKHCKGWVGELIETSLGATAGSLPEPDFQHIGVELKTLPVNKKLKPSESTYVCTVPLTHNQNITWESSLVKIKLSRVLWVPVEAEPEIPMAERRVGQPILWSPDPAQEKVLRHDWEELTEMIILGDLDKITARHGEYLQIRPKAANAKILRDGIDQEGNRILTLPRGFYLRVTFTQQILKMQTFYEITT